MPAAKRNRVGDPAVRAKIRATQLVKLMQRYALGENDDFGQPIKLSAGRRSAIKTLLAKVLPDLDRKSVV